MLENTEGAIKNGQSRETGNIVEENKAKKKTTQYVLNTTICKTNTNNVNKKSADYARIVTDITTISN